MKKKFVSLIMLGAFFITSISHAASFEKDKQDIIYGVALNDQQRKIVDNAFGIDSSDFNKAVVNGKDLEKYLGYSTSDSNMISSVTVKRLEEGAGIRVKIDTPSNISTISEAQYTNAAITAGISDAEIRVASPKPVTGESALVGVYKSNELHGKSIDTKRTKTAQDELKTVIEVSKQNEDKTGFDSEKLDKAIIEVKQKLADYKQENGDTADASQIETYIKDALNDVEMGDILSTTNVEKLTDYFNSYQNTSAVDSKEVSENLFKLAKDLGGKASKFYEENKDSIDKFAKDNKENIEKIAKDAKDSGLLDKIINFFKDIFNSMFSSSDDGKESSK